MIVYEFAGVGVVAGELVQLPQGGPHVKTSANGALELSPRTRLILMVGPGTITWDTEVVEDFDEGVERYRLVDGGSSITLGA